jgi:retron-type reverse transcriptase
VASFDNIPQDLLLRAVKKHAKERWMVLYIERWLQAPVQEEDGQLVPREKGTPQGGVISPVWTENWICLNLRVDHLRVRGPTIMKRRRC